MVKKFICGCKIQSVVNTLQPWFIFTKQHVKTTKEKTLETGEIEKSLVMDDFHAHQQWKVNQMIKRHLFKYISISVITSFKTQMDFYSIGRVYLAWSVFKHRLWHSPVIHFGGALETPAERHTVVLQSSSNPRSTRGLDDCKRYSPYVCAGREKGQCFKHEPHTQNHTVTTLLSQTPTRVLLTHITGANRTRPNLVQKHRKALFFDERAERCELPF